MRFNAKTLALAVILSCQTAFAATDSADLNDKLSKLNGTIDSINGELNSQRASISSLKTEIDRSNTKLRKQILDELKAVQRQNQYVYDALLAEKEKSGGKMNVKPLRNYDLQTPDGKMILGEDEYVYVKETNATIVARIDTGASQSSISATDISEFERSGKKWLRFNVIHNDRIIPVEAPYVKQMKLRQSSIDGYSTRPVVKLNIKIGDFSTEAEFNLIDRTSMQYALLIGRNLLTDISVVDVSRRYVQPRSDKDGLLILCIDDYNENVKKGMNVNEKYDEIQKENAGGAIATTEKDGAESLGTNPEKALPSVRDKIETENGSKPTIKTDKKADDEKAEPVKDEKKAASNSKKSKKKLSDKEKAALELSENYKKKNNSNN